VRYLLRIFSHNVGAHGLIGHCAAAISSEICRSEQGRSAIASGNKTHLQALINGLCQHTKRKAYLCGIIENLFLEGLPFYFMLTVSQITNIKSCSPSHSRDIITPDNFHLHGFHLRENIAEQNKIFISSDLIDALESQFRHTTERWCFIFLLLATLAHEYGHWLRLLVFGTDDTPPQLGYDQARIGAKDGEGESGYVAEIALFNGFVQAERNGNGDYQDFRIIDRWSIPHEIPIKLVQEYWEKERFEPFEFDSVLNFWLLAVICLWSLAIVTSGNSGRYAIIDSGGLVARYQDSNRYYKTR
jgi:hypothetical protein